MHPVNSPYNYSLHRATTSNKCLYISDKEVSNDLCISLFQYILTPDEVTTGVNKLNEKHERVVQKELMQFHMPKTFRSVKALRFTKQ